MPGLPTALRVTKVVEIACLVMFLSELVLRLMGKLTIDQFTTALWLTNGLIWGAFIVRWRLNKAAAKAAKV